MSNANSPRVNPEPSTFPGGGTARPTRVDQERDARPARQDSGGEGREKRGMYILAFTRYCYYHYCMVHGIQTEGREGVVYCATVVQ